jgi:hypothetical protein
MDLVVKTDLIIHRIYWWMGWDNNLNNIFTHRQRYPCSHQFGIMKQAGATIPTTVIHSIPSGATVNATGIYWIIMTGG